MNDKFFDISIDTKRGPVLATAIHDGHLVREELNELFKLSPDERMREEDAHTGTIARAFPNHLIVNRSRFEVDLNRSEEKAVYQKPEDAWGLEVWKEPLSEEMVHRSKSFYQAFYNFAEEQIQQLINTFGYAIVYDIHSYNYRREGPEGPVADPKGNPDIDVLTHGIDLDRWRGARDQFIEILQNYPFPGGPLNVQEEVRFEGRKSHFMQWVLNRFNGKVFAPSIEFKKIYMNEWTNELYCDKLEHLSMALKSTVPAVIREAENRKKKFLHLYDRS